MSQYAYTVNPLGQRDKVETVGTAFGVTPVWNWAYNPRGELVSAKDTSANNRKLGYIYDGIGNRLATGDAYSVTAGVEQVTNPVAYTPNALNQYTVAKGVTLPTTPAPAPYDFDGNLRFDGGVNKDNEAREYIWDGENRLIAVKRTSDNTTLITYAYDSQSRRISRSAGVAPTNTWYLYDGWNVVAEYTGSTPALSRTQTWGTDLSGTMQGAGGVGGLLVARIGGINYFATYDGNGNVSEYLTTAGVVAAHFEYDPFGNLTAFTEQTQSLAASFTYRFSTKPIDSVTGWFYYGYRYYDPVTGRWPSRDPIGEEGGANLYAFVENDGVNALDHLGLARWWKAKVVSKSFIESPYVVGGWGRAGVADGSNARLRHWLSVVGGGDAFRQNPTDDSKDGEYRLYGTTTVTICCNDTKLVSYKFSDEDMEGGLEISKPEVRGTIDGLVGHERVSDSTMRLELKIWGRPAAVAELSFQAVKPRRSYYIWNMARVELFCDTGGVGKYRIKAFEGSKFPSSKLWINGDQKRYVKQGKVSDLWSEHPKMPGFVAE